tara:strand:+ start:197 stop:391 length:195 start_codon:yes stop_codon:yes gene_type:complete
MTIAIAIDSYQPAASAAGWGNKVSHLQLLRSCRWWTCGPPTLLRKVGLVFQKQEGKKVVPISML